MNREELKYEIEKIIKEAEKLEEWECCCVLSTLLGVMTLSDPLAEHDFARVCAYFSATQLKILESRWN